MTVERTEDATADKTPEVITDKPADIIADQPTDKLVETDQPVSAVLTEDVTPAPQQSDAIKVVAPDPEINSIRNAMGLLPDIN